MFYLIDKPIGPSSNQVLSHIKRHFGTKKAGYAGTLDPLASGLLIVATDGSTKLLSFLESHTKTYEFEFDITRTSQSLDLGTPTIQWIGDKNILKPNCTSEKIQQVFTTFLGKGEQIPPRYSAIKIDGNRSYVKARNEDYKEKLSEAEIFVPKKRTIYIHSLELLEYNFPFIRARTKVEAGTYIRSLARDIGESLGATAVVTELRRIACQEIIFGERTFSSIEFRPNEMTRICPISYTELFSNMERFEIHDEHLRNIHTGNPILIAKSESYIGEVGSDEVSNPGIVGIGSTGSCGIAPSNCMIKYTPKPTHTDKTESIIHSHYAIGYHENIPICLCSKHIQDNMIEYRILRNGV